MRAALEAAVTELLAPLQPPAGEGRLVIETFPETPETYKVPGNAKGAVLVSYAGMRRTGRAESVQPRRFEFDVSFLLRHLRTHEGVYAYLDRADALVTGKQVIAGGCVFRTQFEGDRYTERDENAQWQYVARVTCTEL